MKLVPIQSDCLGQKSIVVLSVLVIFLKVVKTVVYQNRLSIFENRLPVTVIDRDHPTDLGLCYSDVTGQLAQNTSFKCRPRLTSSRPNMVLSWRF